MSDMNSAKKGTSTSACSVVAAVTIMLTFACGTGAAAFAGLLPASKNVAVAVTATPLIDMQVEAAANGRMKRHALD